MANLLPWREEERKIIWRRFMLSASAGIICIMAFTLLINLVLIGKIEIYQKDNYRMRQLITALTQSRQQNAKIAEKINIMATEIKQTETLVLTNQKIVQMLKTIAQKLPTDISLLNLQQQDHQMHLLGTAHSYVSMQNFLRSLEQTKIFAHVAFSLTRDPHQNNLLQFSMTCDE
jgi:Tfp pilus assembly protein PilN